MTTAWPQESGALAALLAENARLVALLEANGIGWQNPPAMMRGEPPTLALRSSKLSTDGRLHREQAGKSNVQSIEFVDGGHGALLRMRDKRQRGYRAMGYRIADAGSLPVSNGLISPEAGWVPAS